MKLIFKYELKSMYHGADNTVYMPEQYELLDIQNQDGTVCLWAVVDNMAPKVAHVFRVLGTGFGDEILENGSKYLRTVQHREIGFVWHIFERGTV
jgi:hypothetical protein